MIKKVKRKRLNLKRTIFFILLIYVMCYSFYYILNQPIKHIYITGNSLVKDSDIIRLSNLKDYPSIFKYRNNTIEKKIKKHKLIDQVDVKKTFGFTININIVENKILFYYLNEEKIMLSNGNLVKNDLETLVGIPTFINECSKELLQKFQEGFSKLNTNIIFEIDSIEYFPNINNDGKLLSDNRFKILMNDGNTIIVNTKSVNVLNKYNDIYASLGGKSGIINLDSDKLSNLVFIPYGE